MPPKEDSKKPKAAEKKSAPATPDKKAIKSEAKSEETPKKEAPKKEKETPKKPAATPKKANPSVDFKPLAADAGAPIPIDVRTECVNGQAVTRKAGGFGQLLDLRAPDKFSVLKTIIIDDEDSPFKGLQAIIIQPAKPFRFLDLKPEIRNRIYKEYFAFKSVKNESIVVDGKRATNKEAYAKTYAEGLKNRVALLAVKKEISHEATEILYAHTLTFDNTSTLLDFVLSLEDNRTRLTDIEVKSYLKQSARNAFSSLAESPNLKRLHFEMGVTTESDPAKAAKAFYTDAHKFLKVIGAAKGDPTAGVDILSFKKSAFAPKEGKNTWDDESIEEFKEALKAKMK